MWTLTDTLIILASLLIHAALFYGMFALRPSKRWQKYGEKILANKEKQLEVNWLLRLFKSWVDAGKMRQASLLIATLIYLKCIGMFIGGMVLIGLIFVPIQGMLMAVITKELQKKGISGNGLKKTQSLQLTCMLLLNAAGNLIWYKRNIEEMATIDTISNYYPAVLIMGFVALIFALLAANQETKFFKAHRTFMG